MGNKLYVDSNMKKFTTNKITSLPIELLTDVKMTIVEISSNVRHKLDSLGNKLYIDNTGNVTTSKQSYVSDDVILDMSNIDVVIGDSDKNTDTVCASDIKNKPYLQNTNFYKLVSIDEKSAIGLDVDNVIYADATNLLEKSIFSKAIIDIMDCIVGGTYNSYCSFKVSLNPGETVIFNMDDVNITNAMRMYNMPLDVDIYVNSHKISKDNLDDYLGIYHAIESNDLNIKLVNVTTRNVAVVNPIILFT